MTPVTYNYSFFHFIFALASMYLAMLMTGGARSDPTAMHTSWSFLATLTGKSLSKCGLVVHLLARCQACRSTSRESSRALIVC